MLAGQQGEGWESPTHTLLDTVLLGTVLDALDALLEVVLSRGALLGIPALCVFGCQLPVVPRV
jgi:hypothetical protein